MLDVQSSFRETRFLMLATRWRLDGLFLVQGRDHGHKEKENHVPEADEDGPEAVALEVPPDDAGNKCHEATQGEHAEAGEHAVIVFVGSFGFFLVFLQEDSATDCGKNQERSPSVM